MMTMWVITCMPPLYMTGAVVGVHKVKARLWSANSHASSTPLITNFTETLHFVVRNGSQLQVRHIITMRVCRQA